MTNTKHPVTREAVLSVIRVLGPITVSDIYEELDEQSGGRYGEEQYRLIQLELASLEEDKVVYTSSITDPEFNYIDGPLFQLRDPTTTL